MGCAHYVILYEEIANVINLPFAQQECFRVKVAGNVAHLTLEVKLR